MIVENSNVEFFPDVIDLNIGEDMDCPKCGSKSARFEEDHSAVFMRCFCGLYKLYRSKYSDGTSVDHIDIDEDVTLPKRGTKLMIALGALSAIEPSTTGQVAELINVDAVSGKEQSNSDVASQLTILRYKGLCVITEYKRGVSGGSTWKTTEIARKLLGRF